MKTLLTVALGALVWGSTQVTAGAMYDPERETSDSDGGNHEVMIMSLEGEGASGYEGDETTEERQIRETKVQPEGDEPISSNEEIEYQPMDVVDEDGNVIGETRNLSVEDSGSVVGEDLKLQEGEMGITSAEAEVLSAEAEEQPVEKEKNENVFYFIVAGIVVILSGAFFVLRKKKQK